MTVHVLRKPRDPDALFDARAIPLDIICHGCGAIVPSNDHDLRRDADAHAAVCRRDLLDEVKP